MSDLRGLDERLQKDGYWLHGSGYGYDYPMNRQTLGPPVSGSTPEEHAWWHVRPGYEVRTLMAAANILARRDQQRHCQDLLDTAQNIFDGAAANPYLGEIPKAIRVHWRGQQIATARSVSAFDYTYRTDHLIGTDVVNPSNEELGSVVDVIQSPRTGAITYLLIARGGLFGIDEKYLPVPWKDFKVPFETTLLVLNASNRSMDAAPELKEGQFSPQGDYGALNVKVDEYWKVHLLH